MKSFKVDESKAQAKRGNKYAEKPLRIPKFN